MLIHLTLGNTLYEMKDQCPIARALYNSYFESNTGNFLSNEGSYLSYLPIAYCGDDVLDKYAHPKRVKGKPARIARKLFENNDSYSFSDAQYERFHNLFTALTSSDKGRFIMLRGDDILWGYDGQNYGPGDSLNKSCMRHESCQDYFDLYTRNNNVALLCLKKDTFVMGRALIWNDTIMDNIYGSEVIAEMFNKYAKDHNMQHADNLEGVKFIDLEHYEFMYYPYLDTFKYLNMEEGWLSNDKNQGHTHVLDSLAGHSTIVRVTTRCSECEDISEVLYDGMCDNCYHRYTCDKCGGIDHDCVDGFCTSCYDEWHCNRCGDQLSSWDHNNHESWCRDCYKIFSCKDCGHIHEYVDVEITDEPFYCEECFVLHHCDVCGKHHDDEADTVSCCVTHLLPQCAVCEAQCDSWHDELCLGCRLHLDGPRSADKGLIPCPDRDDKSSHTRGRIDSISALPLTRGTPALFL